MPVHGRLARDRRPAPAGLTHNCLRKAAGNRSRSGLKEKLTVAAYTEPFHRRLITQKTGPGFGRGFLVPPNSLRGSWGGAVFNLMANDTGNIGPGPAQVDLPGSFPGWLSSPVSPFRRAGPPPKSNFAVWAGALRSPLALGHVSGGSWRCPAGETV